MTATPQGEAAVFAAHRPTAPVEPLVFRCLCSLVSRVTPLRLLCDRNAGAFADWAALFSRVLGRAAPKTAAALQRLDVDPSLFLVPWTVSRFTRVLGLEVAVRLWDRIVIGGTPELLRCSVGLAVHLQPAFVGVDFERAMASLLRAPAALRDEFALLACVDAVQLTDAELAALRVLDAESEPC